MFETETKKLLSLAKKSNIDFVINKTLERECNILSGMNIPYRSYTTDSELKNIQMNNNTVVLARPHEYNLFHSTPDFFDKMFFKCNSDNLRDFFSDVFPVYTATILNKVFFPHIQLMITPRCTLTCQECCNGCQLWNKKDKSQDMSLDDIKESIDAFFSRVSYTGNVILVGGEIMLCQELLRDAIEYIGSTYSNRFYSLKIFSNATIVPEKFLIESMKRYRTEVLLSDYRNEVPSQSFNFGKTLSILKRNKIHTFVFYPDARYWFDYGFGKQKNSKEDTVRIRENCIEGYPIYKCFEIRGSKLYYCSMAMSAFLVRNIDISKENHLDISKDHPAIKYANFCLGHEPESKMKSCRFCNGMEKEHIPCGKQVKND